jgi:hypothetical protein
MTETAERLKLELSQLSAEERAELAYFLIHSLDEETPTHPPIHPPTSSCIPQ